MTKKQLQEIAKQRAQTKKEGATFLPFVGTILVMFACYGFTFENNIDYMIVLIFGFAVAMIGFIGLKE